MKFQFGKEEHTHIVEAKNLDQAIRIFKASVLFPEEYVDKKYIPKNKKGFFIKEYDHALSRYIIEFKSGAKISIYEHDTDKKIGSVLLDECVNVDLKSLLPQINLLEGPKSINPESTEILPVIGSKKALINTGSKKELRDKHDEILRKKYELEAMRQDLNKSLSILTDELDRKKKAIYILETFLGINEEILQIAEGPAAPEEDPLTLYQQRLYMDEEVGLWEEGGLDICKIEVFDEWILKNFKRYLYAPKSICAFRVRRERKDYGDMWINMSMDSANKTTYLLIRNGDNLYRIFSDISIGERLFPATKEFVELYEEWSKWGEERLQEKLRDCHESYLFGLLAIQGIIERTPILGSSLRQTVNLMRPDGIPEDKIKLIRDDESEFYITDGRPRWQDFIKKNRESIKQGTRVILTEKRYDLHSQKESDRWRCDPFRPDSMPSRDTIYTIDREASPGSYHSGHFIFYYNDGKEYWDRYTRETKTRKRNIPWRAYRDEIINVDAITLEDAKYYRTNRLDRKSYLSILPTLKWLIGVKMEEQDLEEEFVKLVAGQLSWDETQYPKIRKQIEHWKLKNKWKRALTKDEALALRMIIKVLKRTK